MNNNGLLLFFFSSRRRHTRYWRDWSSDVCSSDLPLSVGGAGAGAGAGIEGGFFGENSGPRVVGVLRVSRSGGRSAAGGDGDPIGRAAWRGRVEMSVGGGSIKKKKCLHTVSDPEDY